MTTLKLDSGLDISKFKQFILSGIIALTVSILLNTVSELDFALKWASVIAGVDSFFIVSSFMATINSKTDCEFTIIETNELITDLVALNGFVLFLASNSIFMAFRYANAI